MSKNLRLTFIDLGKAVLLLLALTPCAWSRVFVQWSTRELPSKSSLGVSDLVFFWKSGISPQLAAAREQGYRVYLQTTMQSAKDAAEDAAKAGCTGIMLKVPDSQSKQAADEIARLQPAYPKLKFLTLNPDAKVPNMRGSLIVMHDSVLEVSSPTAQPWIDSNLALVKVEQRAHEGQVPLYTFPWSDRTNLTATDYSLAVAEAGAFHAHFVLQLDEHLQQALNAHDASAWALWNQVRSMMNFSADGAAQALAPAANVAVILDQLDASDEVLNLLSRHNIPSQVFLAGDLGREELDSFNILIVFAKPGREGQQRITDLATHGATVVIVNAHDQFPWQGAQRVQLNEHTISYAMGSGKILELSEPVTDPETFAQDIRRLMGKRNSLLSLWNGLTTIAVPYRQHDGTLSLVELVNYSAEPVRVQLQVKGQFKSVRYESPEDGCCKTLTSTEHDGFTEFVIPDLFIAGRVHLQR